LTGAVARTATDFLAFTIASTSNRPVYPVG
jgi:hypothetical protein